MDKGAASLISALSVQVNDIHALNPGLLTDREVNTSHFFLILLLLELLLCLWLCPCLVLLQTEPCQVQGTWKTQKRALDRKR